jgi:hypothetical protein
LRAQNDDAGRHNRRPVWGIAAVAAACATVAGVCVGVAGVAGPAAASVSARGYALVLTPNRGAESNYLDSVSCSTTTCMAAGEGDVGGVNRTLFEQRTEHGWRVLESPNLGLGSNLISGVDCRSTTFCMAVGWRAAGTGYSTLIERWNGESWSVMPSPVVSGPDDELYGVSCPTTTTCVAVGRGHTTPEQTLIEVWRGRSWSVVTSPNPSPAADDFLYGVSCPKTTWCAAVGYDYLSSVGRSMIDILHDGHWSLSRSVDRGSGTYDYAVACPSPSMCRMVGDSTVGAGAVERTIIEAWNGQHWSIAPSPDPAATTSSYLSDVNCPTATTCEAVGASRAGGWRNLAERWTGDRWSVVATPTVPGGDNSLVAVSCTSATRCTSAGQLQLTVGNIGRTYVLVGH